jgi:hypothetical protein
MEISGEWKARARAKASSASWRGRPMEGSVSIQTGEEAGEGIKKVWVCFE